MKKILKIFSYGLVFGSGFICILITVYFGAKARSGLTSSPGDKLTSATWNNLINQVNTLSGKVNSPLSGGNYIYCSRSGASAAPAGWSNITFIASDCGGTLPDTNYYGVPVRVQTRSPISNFGINGTTVSFYINTAAGAGNNRVVTALYFKYK